MAKAQHRPTRSKLTEQDRAEIRRRYEAGAKQKDIAVEFGVSRPYVSTLVQGCTSRRPLTANRKHVEAMIQDGVSDAEIAATFRVGKSSVGRFRLAALKRGK